MTETRNDKSVTTKVSKSKSEPTTAAEALSTIHRLGATGWTIEICRVLGDPVEGITVPASEANVWANRIAERMGLTKA
jgi:hypothetical protein